MRWSSSHDFFVSATCFQFCILVLGFFDRGSISTGAALFLFEIEGGAECNTNFAWDSFAVSSFLSAVK